jgi:O-antigen/teichoic acid export membrane protein
MFGRLNRQQDLVKSILTLFTGSAIAQAIPLLVSPILTRIYPVVDFATLTIIMTLISLVGVVVTGRYEFAIGLPKDDEEGRGLMQITLISTLIIATSASLFLLLFHGYVASWIAFPDDSWYLFVVPLAALFYGIYQAYSMWQLRQRNYMAISGSRISQSLTNSGFSLGLFYTGFGLNGLVIGNLLGHLAAFGYVFLSTKNRIHGFLTTPVKGLRQLASRYGDMPRVNSIHALSDVGQNTAVILMITGFFGSVSTGLYGLTIRIMQAPLNMLGNSMAMVFYKEVAEKKVHGHKVTKLLTSTMKTLLLLSTPIFLVIMVFGPDLFELVFGKDWREAGEYARIMSPWLFLNFIASPLSNLPLIMNKQRKFFLYSMIGNGAVILSLAVSGWLQLDIKSGLMVLSAVQCCFQAAMILFFIRIAKEADQVAQESEPVSSE